MLALQLVGGFAAGFNLPASLTTRNTQSSVSMAVPRASRREALSIGAAAAAFIVASPPRAAFASQDPNDLNRFKKALTGVNYLLDNWDVETTECKAQAGGSGECTDQPDKVRYYFGLRTTDHPLFQLDKLYAKAQAKLPDDADFEEWIEATEGLASQIAKINELAYTSSFGEYNPGGGKEQVRRYLLLCQEQVIKSKESLETIVKLLKI
jgi:Ca2+ transporting ATPase